MLNQFGWGRGLRAENMTAAEMNRDVRPSLFLGASLSSRSGMIVNPAPEVVWWGYVDEVGFGTDWWKPLSDCPPRKAELAKNFYSDRSLSVKRGKKQKVLARIEVKEAPVYDLHYRSEIDFTGFQVTVTLDEEVFDRFLEYAGLTALDSRDEERSHFRDIALRVPSEAFPFPEQRGGSPPYDPVGKYVTDLQVIREFAVDDLVVANCARRATTDPVGSFGERYGVASGLRLWR